MHKLKNILFWSVISAAFIGPGTVTVAAKAGASFGLSLLWALTFSIVATIVLQEGAARLTIATGKTLGQAIAEKFKGKQTIGWMIFLAIAVGCAAYEAGNILGAVSGVSLVFDMDRKVLTMIIVVLATTILLSNNIKIIGNVMGIVVAIMGVAFVMAALNTDFSLTDLLVSSFVPSIPAGSSLLIIGLIGTTVVPYNIFLGSGISKDQQLNEMRSGLIGAVLIGGVISVAVIIVGTNISGEFSFQALTQALQSKVGDWAGLLFGIGLFAAGFTSSITAPLATAVTGQSIFSQNEKWAVGKMNFKLTWMIVLGIGLLFGMTEIKPIPVIILAQAANGLLLPVVAIFLWLLLNDQQLIKQDFANGKVLNILTGLVVFVAIFLGLNNVVKAAISALAIQNLSNESVWIGLTIVSTLVTTYPTWKILKYRNS